MASSRPNPPLRLFRTHRGSRSRAAVRNISTRDLPSISRARYRFNPFFLRSIRPAQAAGSDVRARREERMAHSPLRSDLDRDRGYGLDSAVGRSSRGDSRRGHHLDSTGSETLARRNPQYGDDPHRNTGRTQWQSRELDGESQRQAIWQVIAIRMTTGGKMKARDCDDRGALSDQRLIGSAPAHAKRKDGIDANSK